MYDLAKFLAYHETEEAYKLKKIKRKDRMAYFKQRYKHHVNEMLYEMAHQD